MNNKMFDEMKEYALEIINGPVSDFMINRTNKSFVVSVVRTKNGRLFRGINIGWWHSICAEPSAISNAFISGETEIEYVMAVKKHKSTKEISVISSCGICREMFNEIMPDIKFVIEKNGSWVIYTLDELLPENK